MRDAARDSGAGGTAAGGRALAGASFRCMRRRVSGRVNTAPRRRGGRRGACRRFKAPGKLLGIQLLSPVCRKSKKLPWMSFEQLRPDRTVDRPVDRDSRRVRQTGH